MLAVGVLLVPFAVADLRLADRFTVGVEEESLAGPGDAWAQLGRALESFAGGGGWTFAVFLVLGLAGAVILLRTHTAFAVFGLLVLLAPPLLFMLLRTGSVMGLSPRHLVFALPLWAAAIGAAVARLTRDLPALAAIGAVAAVGLLAVLSPAGGMEDPRDRDNVVLGGGPLAARPAVASGWPRPRTGSARPWPKTTCSSRSPPSSWPDCLRPARR